MHGQFGTLHDFVQMGRLDLSYIYSTVLVFSWQHILRQECNPYSDDPCTEML